MGDHRLIEKVEGIMWERMGDANRDTAIAIIELVRAALDEAPPQSPLKTDCETCAHATPEGAHTVCTDCTIKGRSQWKPQLSPERAQTHLEKNKGNADAAAKEAMRPLLSDKGDSTDV